MSDFTPPPPRFWVVAVFPDDPEPDLRLFTLRDAAVSWIEDYLADLGVFPLPAPSFNSDFFTSWHVDGCCGVWLRLVPVDAVACPPSLADRPDLWEV